MALSRRRRDAYGLSPRAAWRSPALGELVELRLDDCTLQTCSSGSGEPLFFVHGILTNSSVWRKVVPPLAAGYRCIVLDLPMGSHRRPFTGADVSPGGIARMIASAIERYGYERATLVGNDTGGAWCQLVAARCPERLERLVLTSCELRDNVPPTLFKIFSPLARIPGGLLMYLLPGQIHPILRNPLAFGAVSKRPFESQASTSYMTPVVASSAIRADFARFLRQYHKR